MGRPQRAADGGYVYHVLNRGNARMRIFDDEGDFDAFEKVLAEAVEPSKMRLLAYCLLPNHWRSGPSATATSRPSCKSSRSRMRATGRSIGAA
jgi:putative transposase